MLYLLRKEQTRERNNNNDKQERGEKETRGGKTRIVGGEKRSKDDPRVEAYGSVDELNSHLGLCRDLLIKNNQFLK